MAINFGQLLDGVKNLPGKSATFLKEIFDPRVASGIRKSQRDSIDSLLKTYGIDPDNVSKLNAGIKNLNSGTNSRDNTLLKALAKAKQSLEDEVRDLGKKKSQLQKATYDDTLVKRLYATQRELNEFEEKILKLEMDKAALKRTNQAIGAGPGNIKSQIQKIDDELNTLKIEQRKVKIENARLSLEQKQFQDKASREFDMAKASIEAELGPKEDKLKILKETLKFDPDDVSDNTVLANAARDQAKLDTIGRRQLITASLGTAGVVGGMNLMKESMVKSRLQKYLGE